MFFSQVKTSYVAHFCGGLAGLLIGILVLKNRKVEHWETRLKLISVCAFVLLILAASVWNVLGDDVVRAVTGDRNATYFREENRDEAERYKRECHNYI